MAIYEGVFIDLGDNVTKNPDILRIVKEDVLRTLHEKGNTTVIKIIEDEIKVAHPLVSEALEELVRNNLITIQEPFVSLTALGQKSAQEIRKKHFVLENYFKKTRSKIEAHVAAHVLEHYVSREVINNIKKLLTLKRDGVPLTRFKLNTKGMITDIAFSDHRLFERLVSMGIFLGEKITVTNEILHGVVIVTRNKKFALDRDIAEQVKAVKYERP